MDSAAFGAAALIVGGWTVKNVLEARNNKDNNSKKQSAPAGASTSSRSDVYKVKECCGGNGGDGCCKNEGSSKKQQQSSSSSGCCGAGGVENKNGGGCCSSKESKAKRVGQSDEQAGISTLLDAMHEEMPLVSVEDIMLGSTKRPKRNVAFSSDAYGGEDEDDEEEEEGEEGYDMIDESSASSSAAAAGGRKWLPKKEFQALRKAGVIPKKQQSSSSSQSSADGSIRPRACPPLLVLFATQSGNAENFAREIGEEGEEKGFETRVMDLSSFNVEQQLASQRFVIFIIPTWHEGRPPKSAEPLFSYLSNLPTPPPPSLLRLKYIVCGLGNSVYGKGLFNKAAKDLDLLLEEAGCRRVHDVGADDEATLREGFLRWKDSMWTVACPRFGLVNDRGPGDEDNRSELGEGEERDEDSSSESANDEETLEIEDLGPSIAASRQKQTDSSSSSSSSSAPPPKMLNSTLSAKLAKQNYKVVGSHSAVKFCRWTKSMLRGRGGCYKHTFYGISSYQCMESTPSLACANKCVFCWRHHSNPVGTRWRWEMDEPETLVEGFVENHRSMLKEMKGLSGVMMERLEEAKRVRHCALSLVGEPIMYPKINEFLGLLHLRGISSFLVTNSQFPKEMETLVPVTQLYVSIDAADADTLKKVDRPLFPDYWDRFLKCLDVLSTKGQRTVFRLTLVKDYNVNELAQYAKLVQRGKPDFIEIKGVTYTGGKRNELGMRNVPWHVEVVNFGKKLIEQLEILQKNTEKGEDVVVVDPSDLASSSSSSSAAAEPEGEGLLEGGGYEMACEHAHSCCILIAKQKFKIGGKWHTFIDFDKFIELSLSGKSFGAMDYVAPTPEWAVFAPNSTDGGFDPEEFHFRKGEGKIRGGGC